jgi:hypothetical protein
MNDIGNGSLNVILGANSFRALTTGSNNINLGTLMQEIYYIWKQQYIYRNEHCTYNATS